VLYGYDCADELVGISNGAWTPPSCSPTNFVNYNNNINSSAQIAFNLDADGNPAATLVDGVVTNIASRDADERITSETFQACSGSTCFPLGYSYGGLNYVYDADGRLVDKNGSLAAVNMPTAVSTASYSATDQVTNWNGAAASPTPDAASNIIGDPASGLSLTWSARNQVSAVSGGTSEVYEGRGRRESSTGGGYTLDFVHDGSSMIGWSGGGYAGSYSFLTLPGGGTLAGSYTLGGSTTTWVPLVDASGTTIALVNKASLQSAPATTYTYDPSGTPSLSGSGNYWPFLYHGMEKEFSDPTPYYYTGNGQFYSAQLVRSLSEVGQTSSSGPGGGSGGAGGGGGFSPAGMAIPLPSGSSGGLSPQSVANDYQQALQVGTDVYEGASALGLAFGETPLALPLAIIAEDVDFLVNFFEDIFGGGSTPEIPRQLMHGRHPLYPVILGIQDGLIPEEVSAGKPELCGDAEFCGVLPLQKAEDAYQSPDSGQYWQSLHEIPPFAVCIGLVGGYNAGSIIGCVGESINCGSTLFGNPEGPAGCVEALGPCAITGAIIAGCYGVSRNIKQPAPPEGTR